MPSTLTSYSFPFAIRYLIFRRYIPLEQNDYRRKWDKEEYLAKSKAQDAAAQEYAQAAQAAQAAGKKPPPRPRAGDANLGPKPTKALEAREEDLGIEKNLGKSMLVAAGGKGPGAGFYVSDSISSGGKSGGELGAGEGIGMWTRLQKTDPRPTSFPEHLHILSLLVHFHPPIHKLMLNLHLFILEIVVRNVSTDVERQHSVPRSREWTES